MSKCLIPSKSVRARLGDCSNMTLWRYLDDERLGFPRPIIIRNRRFWDAAEIDAFITRQALGRIGGHRPA